MSIRAKYHLLLFVAFPVGSMGLMLLGLLHPALALVAFPYAGLIALLGLRLRCPNCQERVMTQTFTVLGIQMQTQSPYIRRRCDNCGYDLSGRGAPTPPAGREAGQRAVSLFPPFFPNMPLLFGTVVIAGLVCGAGQLLFASTGLGAQFVVPFVRESPLARPLVGLNGALAIPLALAILKRYRYGLVLYFLSMGYGFSFMLCFLWRADIPARTATLVTWVCFGVFVLIYGYLNREWFHPKPDDAT